MKGVRPGTENRCELMKICLEKDYLSSKMRRITEPMEGKSEEEKEQIAAELLEKVRAGEYDE
jgi:hypothetical protein